MNDSKPDARHRPIDTNVLHRIRRDITIWRARPAQHDNGVFSSPAHGAMRRDGALTRFADLTRDA